MRAQVEAGRHSVFEHFEAHRAGSRCNVIGSTIVVVVRTVPVAVAMTVVMPFAAQKPRARGSAIRPAGIFRLG